MSTKLQQMMAAKKLANATKPVVVIRDPVVPAIAPTVEAVAVEAKPATSFIAAPKTTGALTAISTKLTSALTAAEQKVADQTAAGVYELPPAAHELMGGEAEELILAMQNLDAAIVDRTPAIRTFSYAIRKNLEQYPELVHILKEEQLHIMVQGYLTIAGVKTAPKTKAAASASAGKKADSAIAAAAGKSMDELF